MGPLFETIFGDHFGAQSLGSLPRFGRPAMAMVRAPRDTVQRLLIIGDATLEIYLGVAKAIPQPLPVS